MSKSYKLFDTPDDQTTMESKERKISFRFHRMFLSGKWSFDYFGKDFRRRDDAYAGFMKELMRFSSKQLNDLRLLGKKNGYEEIKLKFFNPKFQDALSNAGLISSDTKLVIIQFQNHNYRMICLHDRIKSHILEVIAFDFDYSAYDHG